MSAAISIDVVKPSALDAQARAQWAAFRAAAPAYASPYFDLRYIQAAGAAAPDAEVAILHRGGQVVGFLPFQRRGGAIHPLGAPMTDYHGPLMAPGETISLKTLAEALNARSYRFTGLVAGELDGARGLAQHRTMRADLSGGYDAWLIARQARNPRFFKGKRRNARVLEREVGPLDFSWSRQEQGLIDYVIALKRAQYRRTRQHDIFACGWTERMLRTLAEMNEPDFGLGFATLRAGGALVAAEIGLLSGGVYHLWLPVYEVAYARHGPGMLMTLHTLEAAAAAGVTQVDFGRDDADYKAYFADPATAVMEGFAPAGGDLASRLADRALETPPLRRLAGARARVRRRFDVVAACETTHWRWACGAALALGLMAQGMAPMIRTTPSYSPRRPDVQRTHSRMDGSAEGRVSTPSDDLHASAD